MAPPTTDFLIKPHARANQISVGDAGIESQLKTRQPWFLRPKMIWNIRHSNGGLLKLNEIA